MERKSNRKLLWLIAALLFTLAGVILCGGCLSLAADSADEAAIETRPFATGIGSPSPDGDVRKALDGLDKQLASSATPKRSPKPSPQISGDDLVHVGEDIPAGTYRSIDPVTDDGPFAICYWLKSSDAEGSKIIDNDLVQGGRPQVTLKAGQWFKSQGCPEWRRK